MEMINKLLPTELSKQSKQQLPLQLKQLRSLVLRMMKIVCRLLPTSRPNLRRKHKLRKLSSKMIKKRKSRQKKKSRTTTAKRDLPSKQLRLRRPRRRKLRGSLRRRDL